MSTEYDYSISGDFLNGAVDPSKLQYEILVSDIKIALESINTKEAEDICLIYFKDTLSSSDKVSLLAIVNNHDGAPIPPPATPVTISNELRDASGKIRFHQTSRKMGTHICWTGEGDDCSDPTIVGHGTSISIDYKIDMDEPLIKYIDFNIIENETHLHEGYITWKECRLDKITLDMVPRVVQGSADAGTNFDLYGPLVIPAPPGAGTFNLQSDITQPNGGLVQIPDGDTGKPMPCFWDAEWNVETKVFENITPNPSGMGNYNLFGMEVVFSRFARNLPLLGTGFIALNSSDTDEIGHGMRLKMYADTNVETQQDHNWQVACILCMHRAKTF